MRLGMAAHLFVMLKRVSLNAARAIFLRIAGEHLFLTPALPPTRRSRHRARAIALVRRRTTLSTRDLLRVGRTCLEMDFVTKNAILNLSEVIMLLSTGTEGTVAKLTELSASAGIPRHPTEVGPPFKK
jgi:hypothetical protein